MPCVWKTGSRIGHALLLGQPRRMFRDDREFQWSVGPRGKRGIPDEYARSDNRRMPCRERAGLSHMERASRFEPPLHDEHADARSDDRERPHRGRIRAEQRHAVRLAVKSADAEMNGRMAKGKSMASKPTARFDTRAFLGTLEKCKSRFNTRNGKAVFCQGDAADSVFYIETGKVKLTVVSAQAKEAVIGILDPKQFFGE